MRLRRIWNMGLTTAAALVAGSAAAQQPGPAVPVPKQISLVGVTQIGNRVQAWLINRQTRAKATLSPGESAFGYRLRAVGPEQVTLVRNGKEFVLRLDDRQSPESQVAGYRSEVRPSGAAAAPDTSAPAIERAPAGTTGNPPPQVVNEVVVEPARPVVTEGPENFENFGDVDPRYPVALDPYVGSGYAPFYVPEYLGTLGYPPPWASQYPVITRRRNLYSPYTPDWPEDLRFVPSLRWNPQTFRRDAGDVFGAPFSANPQTRRRRTVIERFAPGTWGPYYPHPVSPYGLPYGW